MKTAISIRDDLFKRAEKFARHKKVSRSRLYSDAIEEYISRQETNDITANLNEVYSKEDSTVDPVALKMAMMSLPSAQW